MKYYQPSIPTDEDIIRTWRAYINIVVKFMNTQVRKELGLDVQQINHKHADNITRGIDIWTHTFYELKIHEEFGETVTVTGEEAQIKEEAKGVEVEVEEIKIKEPLIKNITTSIDAVDGTDLVYRGFYNWCTAIFFYIPNERIIASFVGIPSGTNNPPSIVYSEYVNENETPFAQN